MKTSSEFTHPIKVGVVGYSSGKFDEDKARTLLFSALESLYKEHEGSMTIVSGLTNLGIPKLAYEFAKKKHLKTVGIACAKAIDYETYPCNKQVLVGSNWGDETQYFLSSIDYMIRIGGGAQTQDEVKKFKTMYDGEKIMEFELERTE